MKEKFNESTNNRPEGERLIDAPFVVSDLSAHIKQITEEDSFFINDRNAITLFKSEGISVVLVALRSGAEMSAPEPSGNIAILQVLSGSFDIEIKNTTSSVGKQQIVSFHGSIPYHILATEEVIFLLTFYH